MKKLVNVIAKTLLVVVIIVAIAFWSAALGAQNSYERYIIVSVKVRSVREPGRDALDRLMTRINIRYKEGFRIYGKVEEGVISGKTWGYYILMERKWVED